MVKKIFFALAAIVSFLPQANAQKSIEGLIDWLNTHPVDSVWVLNAHKVSYRSSETDVKQSFAYYEKVSIASDSMNFTYGKALAQINLALLLFNSANFDASNKAYFKAIEYAEKGGFSRLVAISYNNIAENFFTLKDYSKCREYAIKAISINQDLYLQNNPAVIKDTTQQKVAINNQKSARRGVAINYELLFRCNIEEGHFNEAGFDLQKGFPFIDDSTDSYIISPYYLGIGRLQLVYNRRDSAAFYFEKALKVAKDGGELRNESAVYLKRATLMPNISVQQQLHDLNNALQIARETQYLEGVANAAEAISNVYDKQQNKDSSLFYYRVYRSASDSLFSENNKRNVIIKESEWILRKKDLENNQLKGITNLQEKEIVTKNSLLIGGAVTLVLAIALGILAYTSIRNKKRRVELQQKQQEAELKSQVTDMEFKAFKAQLNPHFIFNYLNSVSGYILLSQPEKASDMVKRFSRMLRNVLQNSEQNEVPLADDIKTIEHYLELMQEIASPPFTYTVKAADELQQLQKSVPPLFIQPYVENAVVHGLKHAEGDNLFLKIVYQKNGSALEVIITDNGTGFNLKMLRSKQLQDSRVHLGLSVTEKRIQVFADKNGYNANVQFSTPNPNTPQPGTQVFVVVHNFFS